MLNNHWPWGNNIEKLSLHHQFLFLEENVMISEQACARTENHYAGGLGGKKGSTFEKKISYLVLIKS